MKKKLFLTILGICMIWFSKNVQAQIADSLKTYIDSAIYFMQEKSLYGKNLNWKKIKSAAYSKANGA